MSPRSKKEYILKLFTYVGIDFKVKTAKEKKIGAKIVSSPLFITKTVLEADE